MEKKYELTEETSTYMGETIHRIRALRDFGLVMKGDLGGWVKSEYNLSHEGKCWIYDNAIVTNNAVVSENAIVRDRAKILHSSRIYGDARVEEDAIVGGKLRVFSSCNNTINILYGCNSVLGLYLTEDSLGAHVFGHAVIRENAKVHHSSKVHGDAIVCGDVDIGGRADVVGGPIVFGGLLIGGFSRIYGDSIITSNDDYITIGPIGSRADYTTFSKYPEGIYVACGCFEDSIQEFEKCVNIVHEGTKYEEEYLAAIACAKKKLLGGN